MTEQITPPEGGETGADSKNRTTPNSTTVTPAVDPAVQKLIDGILADPTRAAEEMKRLRGESKQRRLAAEKAETERQQAEQAKLESAKEYETLSKTQKQQLDEWRPKVERLTAMETFVQEMAQKRIDALPKQWQSAVPDFDDPLKTWGWLETNAALFARPTIPDLNPGEQGDDAGKSAAARLTPEELALAKHSGMTAEQFATYKARRKPADAK